MGIPQDVAKGLDLFRSLVFDTAVEAEVAALTAEIAAIPIVGPLLEGFIVSIVKGFADRLYNRLGGMVVFGTVLFVDLAHRKAFDKASTRLQQVAIEKGITSPEFAAEHEREKEALKRFGQFNIVQPGLTDKLKPAALAIAALFMLTSCAVQIPNTKFCAVAGVMEAGMDCYHTLSDDYEAIPALEIKDFLEARAELKDAKGTVIRFGHGAAICQPMEDWGAEHTALELACEKLGASCTYEIKKLIDGVNAKVDRLNKVDDNNDKGGLP